MTYDLLQGFSVHSRTGRRRMRRGHAMAMLLATVALVLSIAAIVAVISFGGARVSGPAKASLLATERTSAHTIR
jgi:hypothetical protein